MEGAALPPSTRHSNQDMLYHETLRARMYEDQGAPCIGHFADDVITHARRCGASASTQVSCIVIDYSA